MKKMFRICSILLCLLFLTTACQPTPEKEAVVGKNDGILEEAIHSQVPVEAEIHTEDRWYQELVSSDHSVEISIDAEVETPDVSNVPVLSIRPHFITDEEAATAVKTLMGDATLYEYTLDRDIIMDAILSFRADVESLKRDGTYSPIHKGSGAGEKAENPEDSIELYERKLAEAEKAYEEAEVGRTEITEFKLTRQDGGSDQLILMDGQDIPATFSAYVNRNSNSSSITYENFHGNNYFLAENQESKLKTTREEAEKKAISLVQKIGVDDVRVADTMIGSADTGGNNCYIISLERMVAGVPCTNIEEYNGTYAYGIDGAEYREPWYPESIEVLVDDTGVIGFEWENPPEILETLNEGVAMLTIEEMQKLAAEQLPRVISRNTVLGTQESKITINRMCLSMMRVAQKDSNELYYYLPVWDFMGGYGDTPVSQISFLTLNAIDGSVIDRGLGY